MTPEMKTNMELLKGKHIELRPMEIDDLDFIYHWENDPGNWSVGYTLNPLSRFHLEQYILGSANDIYADRQLRLIIARPGVAPLGIIDLFDFDPHHRRAAVGVFVAGEFRGEGYAAEALVILLAYAQRVLGLKQLYCGIGSANLQSLSLFEKQGFKITGTRKAWRWQNGNWEDEYFLQHLFF